ncbi:MAG: cysteine hydrolase family protein, partial [Polyangia bacterium]
GLPCMHPRDPLRIGYHVVTSGRDIVAETRAFYDDLAMLDTSDNLALILVDLQNDYFPGGRNPVVGARAAADVARKVLDKAREKHETVIHVQHVSIRPGATFFLRDTPGIDFHPLVAPQPGEIIVQKHHPNAFRETALLQELRNREITRIFFCGMMTHMCIDTTVRAASDLGFRCVVVGEATATKDLTWGEVTVPAAHVQAAFLAGLNGLFAKVI